ncbi:hypothetical protein [Actinoplanes derwentensis]|uniref:Polyketide cyclase / dehydrase and lipid transport n=1 Tax=Actinoplanes derwentensis TaxID=113562 RepID=A0A1H2B5P5_9ACTN|nr:hypothetical protein [Actinoplanes derwentensis]GID87687.1 hypothetical protein Ade03nite_66110 [Actinoplanes derwentensis]SDT53610.1 hypothetical protein SAMN04489716_4365 [Actinoplanes derwentensis]
MNTKSRVVAALVVAAAVAVLRRRQLRWGATGAEAGRALTGDELVPAPDLTATRAITVRAGVADVWPWVVQLGQGRGGFYSYDSLENLIGCDIHSAARINPGWQYLAVGDPVRLAPEVALTVAIAERPRSLVLQGAAMPGAATAPYDFTWTFDLLPGSAATTRLIVRERYAYTRWWGRLLVEPLAVVSFLMSRRMLRGIRDRAEQQLPERTLHHQK